MITEEIVHIRGYPKKLVVFLHGYCDAAPFLDRKLNLFYNRLDNIAVHLPQSPFICEIHQNNRQWYSMNRFDPQDLRKTVPTMEECAAFYDRMTPGLSTADDLIRPYIEQALQDYNLEYKDLILCGFSQGAMLALYSGLMSSETPGAVISFSGILAGAPRLMKFARCHPDTLLIHGSADDMVRPAAQLFTRDKLEQLGCKVSLCRVGRCRHEITPRTVEHAVEYIKLLNL